MRIFIDLHRKPQRLRYTDSMNAAIVAAMAEAGVASKDMVGREAHPWTFGMSGVAQPEGHSLVSGLTISTPSEVLASALMKIRPEWIKVKSSNGDEIDCAGARRHIGRMPAEGASELAVFFASPILIKAKGDDLGTDWVEDFGTVDFDAALRRSCEVRAGRDLDITFSADPLTLAVGVTRRLVHLRKAPCGRKVILPAFSLPLTMRGDPQDLRFAYMAGLGAKTRAGFGCPILPQ
jgi:CRISPR-associated endoribonuclease Cas6